MTARWTTRRSECGNLVRRFRIFGNRMAGRRRHSILGCDTRAVSMWLFWMPTTIGCRGSFRGWWRSLRSIRTRGWCITDCVNWIRVEGRIWDAQAAAGFGFSAGEDARSARVTHGFRRRFWRFGEARSICCCRFRRALTIQADALFVGADGVCRADRCGAGLFLAVYRVHGSNLFAGGGRNRPCATANCEPGLGRRLIRRDETLVGRAIV